MPRAAMLCATTAAAAGALGLLAFGTVSSFVALPRSLRDSRRDFHTAKATPAEQPRKLSVRGGSDGRVESRGMPDLLYGTAWKKERTAKLVEQAIGAGFRGIDTACQPKHYQEDLVGEGIHRALAKDPNLEREHLFIQTKYTPLPGQDPDNVPYDSQAPVPEQVHQSVRRSLENLGVSYIDSLVLHSPLDTLDDTLAAWAILESYVDRGVIRRLGVSNCYDGRLFRDIYHAVRVKPSVLQNRFVEQFGWSDDLRTFCAERHIAFQSFWTLTGNRHVVQSAALKQLAGKLGLTSEQAFFRFVQQKGVTPLSGTTNPQHMREDASLSRTLAGTRWLAPEADQSNTRAGWEGAPEARPDDAGYAHWSAEELAFIDGLMRREAMHGELRKP